MTQLTESETQPGMRVGLDARDRDHLAAWLMDRARASAVTIESVRPLAGGAIQENWLIVLSMKDGVLPGRSELVLRTNSPDVPVPGHSRSGEFDLLTVAREAGVTVPEPLFYDGNGLALGKPAFVMRRVAGTAQASCLVRVTGPGQRRSILVANIGREIAKLHKIKPPRTDLHFLDEPVARPAIKRLETLTEHLDSLPGGWPVLEWGLRWLALNPPAPVEPVLCHGDYRTGNIMVDGTQVTGVLDWEFACWSDPLEDIGWFCARCWRFGADTHEAGGLGRRIDLYQGYEAETGHAVDWSAVGYWEIFATLRWAIIAHLQGLRHGPAGQLSMELALTGRKAVEMEADLLTMIRRVEDVG